MTPEQLEIINSVCKLFTFNGLDDTETTITRENASKSKVKILDLKETIIQKIPKDFTIRLRKGIDSDVHLITFLRQLIRYTKNHRLISERSMKYNKELKKSQVFFKYKII